MPTSLIVKVSDLVQLKCFVPSASHQQNGVCISIHHMGLFWGLNKLTYMRYFAYNNVVITVIISK